MMVRILKRRLQENDTSIYGFIIDGFPKNYSQAKELFEEGEKNIANPNSILSIREMAEIIQPEFEAACKAVIGDLSEEEFQKLFPSTKAVMVEMIKNNPFRLSRGKNGITMEDILKKIEGYNKALD